MALMKWLTGTKTWSSTSEIIDEISETNTESKPSDLSEAGDKAGNDPSIVSRPSTLTGTKRKAEEEESDGHGTKTKKKKRQLNDRWLQEFSWCYFEDGKMCGQLVKHTFLLHLCSELWTLEQDFFPSWT